MSTFKSTGQVVDADITTVYGRLSDTEGLKNLAEGIPADIKEKADIIIENDTLTLRTQQVGEISFTVAKRVPNELIRLNTTSSPIPFNIDIILSQEGTAQTKISVVTKIELNPIIKPMVSKPIQKMTDKFAEFLSSIKY